MGSRSDPRSDRRGAADARLKKWKIQWFWQLFESNRIQVRRMSVDSTLIRLNAVRNSFLAQFPDENCWSLVCHASALVGRVEVENEIEVLEAVLLALDLIDSCSLRSVFWDVFRADDIRFLCFHWVNLTFLVRKKFALLCGTIVELLEAHEFQLQGFLSKEELLQVVSEYNDGC
jgi:hypothetical protein